MLFRYLVLCIFCTFFIHSALSFSFDINAQQKKCQKEDIERDVLVLGEYSSPQTQLTLKVMVLGPDGQELYTTEGNEGKFAFTSESAGEHMFCFVEIIPPGVSYSYNYARRVTLSLRTGVETTDYGEIAKRDHLSKLEVEARKLGDRVRDINKELRYMKRRESRMRGTNESTNARVMWLSVLSMVILVGLGIWQMFHLKRFFKKRKLI